MWVLPDCLSAPARPADRRERRQRLRRALDNLVQAYLATDNVSIDRTCARCGGPHGKPRVRVGGHPSLLRVSVAHSDDIALFAFSGQADIGVDVEVVRPGFDWSPLLDTVFSVAEQRETEASEPDASSRRRCYYERWVAKEAVLKAMGVGLAGPVIDVDTTGGPDTSWNGWAVRALPLGPDVVGALACAERPETIRLLTATA